MNIFPRSFQTSEEWTKVEAEGLKPKATPRPQEVISGKSLKIKKGVPTLLKFKLLGLCE